MCDPDGCDTPSMIGSLRSFNRCGQEGVEDLSNGDGKWMGKSMSVTSRQRSEIQEGRAQAPEPAERTDLS